MEIEIDDEGGVADLSMGLNARTTLKIFRAEPDQVRVSLDSRASHGEMGLGVGLDAEQARRVGEYLISQATALEEDGEE
jgi:hypothetical protein